MHKTTTGTKDINRTIDGTKPDGSTINYSDKVTFNYTTDTDLVNGKTTTKYDHDSQSFNAVPDTVAPASIDGYSRVLNGGTLDSQAVTPNSSDINVHVSYIANDQKILIKAYDVHDNGKTELAIPRGIMTSIIGKSKAVVDTTEVQSAINAIKQYLESNGYTMITKNPVIPTNFDADSKVDQIVELDFDHKTDVIDHGHIPDGSPIKASDLETTVKRTVTVHNTDGSTQTVNQDFTATRTANYDPVTKKVISYNPWSGSSSTFTISPQKGYKSRWTTRFGEGTPISAKSGDTDYQLVPAYDVDAQHITADTVPGQNVDVYYDAQDATRTIKYQDKDTGKIVGSFDSDPGKVGTQVTVDIKGNVPDGYELTPGIEIPTQVDVTTDDVPVVVSVQRKGTTYSYTDKNLPTGVTADDLQKTVKRQIIEHLTTAGQDQDKYINQTANFVRTVTVYPATKDLPQKVVFGEWTPKTDADAVFSEKAIDQVDGYISVEVGSDTVTGHPITVVPSQVVQKSNGEPIDADTFHVYYRKVSTVPEGNIPEGTTKKDGTKLTDADLGTDIIRDIYETAPGTSEPKLVKVQKVRLTRDALVNQYTHEVLGYSDWRINSEYNKNHAADGYADTLPDYTPTAYTGYTPSVAEVTPIIQIDNNTPHLIHVYISYNNQKRTQVINYVDSATGKTVRTQTITGVSNQDSSENLEVPAGYEQDTTKKAENVTFSEDGQSIIAHFQDKDLPTGTIYVKAGQDTYTKDNVPENLRDQVVKEVTRTITVNRPGEKTPQVIKQTVIFHRTIKFDKVTGQVIPETATAWVTDDNSANGTWAEYDAPTIAGYVPTTATVASQSVTADTADANITINYTDNTQNIKLKAVDDTNNASEITIPSGYTTEISGTSSTPVDQDKLQGAIDKIVKALEDEGYKFAGNNTIDTYDNDKTTDQWITIHFTHQTEEDSKGQLPEGVTPEDLEKTITRTVHVKGEPTKGDHDETQTVTATRKAIYDKVAKKIIGYTDWTGAIPVFNIDQYTGYTSKVDGNAAKEVSSVTIDNNTPATLENTVTYEAGDATQIINYVTEDGTKVGTTSISGHVGDALGSGVVDKINGNVPSGYELVSGQNFTNYESNKFSTVDNPISVYVKGENGARAQIIFKDIETSREIGSARDVTGPSGETKEFDLTAPNGYDFVDPTDAKKNITFSTDGKTVIIPVYVKHHTDTIGPNDNPDDATKKLITQSLTGNATRTITVHKIDGSTTTETQTVQMHRSAIIDRATDTVTYTAWEADDPANAAFKEYTPAKQAGYTTLVDGAPKDTVASETPTKPGDETVNVTYKASQKSAEIRYVDSKTKQVVKTDAVTGAPGEKVTNFTTSVPDGYVLDDGQKVPSEVDIAAGDQATDPITVYVHQKIDTLTTDQAKTHGVLDSDLARTVARTVIINEPGKASQTYTQVAHFTRQAQLNEATGAITYTAWTSSDSHFDAISVPEVAGYKSTVAATDPSVGAIDVTAEDRDKFVVVNYTAGDQDLTIRLHDVTDSSKSVDIAVPSDVTSVFHGKSGAAIDSTDLRSAISKIKDELAKQGYQYVGEDMPVDYDTDDKVMQYLDMNFKRVSQTVGPHDTIPEGTKKDDGTDLSEKDLTQTVTRTIYTTDPEDNQTRFTQTVVVTRTATIDMNTKKVTGFSAWSSASFDQYTAPSYKNYTTNIDVDGSGNNVVGRAVTADEIASGQAKDVHITYTKNTQEATPTNIPDGAKKSDGSKLTKDDLEKSVTRTIHFVDENGNKVADDSVEKVTFTRTATLDKDGKVISYSDWTQSGSWDDVTSPEKAGFKATIATIPAVALTPETAKDVEITVTYKPERVIGHIKFVDDKTGALVSDKIVDAKAGQTGVATNAAVPEGYEIAADSEVKTVPASLDFGATDHDDVIIKVSQKVDDVDPDHIPDGVKKSDGTPLTKDDLEKTITRHIHFVYPTSYKGAKDDDFDQTVTIKRTAQYNEATKTVIFGDWQPATLEAYTPADREGLVTPSAVPSLTVDENSQDSSVTLTYTTKTASMNFKAYDDTEGKDITLPSTLQTSISHAGDQTVTQTEIDGVVEGIKSAVGDNYKFEKTETDENGNVVVHFTHKTSPVTPTDSDQATTKEITRIIHVTTPDGKTYNYKQTVTATRTLTRDLVTGKVTEGDWTTPSFDQYGAPQYDGYTSQVDSTNSTEVTAHQVTADEITAGKASDVNVTYQANDQSFKVHFIDAKTGQEVLSPVTYSGKTGENVTIDQSKWNLANYKLVPGQNIPASVKLSAEPSDLYVTVDHNTTQYDTKNPGKFNLSKTITRTIKVVDPVTGATSVVDAESVTFTRTATVDNVDGSVIYSDWTPTGDTTWADFIAPAKTGYTASPETINGKTVSAYDNDETDIITYTANNHDVIVKYVDSTGKEVGNKTISGKTGATIPVDAQSGLPDGYEIDPNKPAPATYTVGDGDGQTIEVHVITGTHTYHEGDSNVPSNIQLAKTVTRTINTISPDGTISTQKQSITFTRTATVNAASGKVTYSDWIASVSSASGKDVTVGPDGVKFSAVTPVEKTGYKTNIDGNLAEETITADSNDSVVNVTYTPEDQSVVVKAVDDDNHGSDITDLIKPAIAALSGKTDAAIDPAQITSAITAAKTALADKYDYVSFDPVTKFGESGQGQLVIHFKHKTETLDKDHTGAGTEDDFVKEVTRTIHLTDTTNATHDYVQHATVSRTATKDLVTGAVTYSDWSVAKFDEFDIPQVDGYKSYAGSTKGDQTTAATQVASADVTVSNNIPQNGTDVYVSYKGNENTNQSIEYVDIATGKTVKTDTVSGIVGQNTTYAGTLPKGYELANNSSIPTSVTITANNTPVKIYVRQITYTDANKPSDLTDALSETITRTIHFEGITHDDVVQSVSFTRTATYNQDTGKYDLSAWTPVDGNKWAFYNAPQVAGYTGTADHLEQVTVDPDTTKNDEETIKYTANAQTARVIMKDSDNNDSVISIDTVNGTTGQNVAISPVIPKGYELDTARTANLPTSVQFTTDGTPTADTVIYLKHKLSSTPSDWPLSDDAYKEATSMTITRTITISKPGQADQVIKQPVTLTRTITFDAVTGAIKSTGAWSTGSWNLVGYVQAPDPIVYNGITYNRVVTSNSSNPAEQGNNALQKETVTSASKSYDVHVTYVANATTLNFKAVDDDNKGVAIPIDGITTSITHQSGQALDSTQVQTIEQAIINKVQGLGYTFVPGVDESNPSEYVLHFKHTTLTLKDNDSTPKGITVDPLNKIIYRTISYKFGDNNSAGLDYSTNESYILKRTATIDLVTKAVEYTDWVMVNSDGTTSTSLAMPYEAIPTAPTGYTFDRIDGHDGTDGQPAWTAIPSMNIDSTLINSTNPTKINLVIRYKVASQTVPVYIYDVDSKTPNTAIGKTETVTVDGKPVVQPKAKETVTTGIRFNYNYGRAWLDANLNNGDNYEFVTGESYTGYFTMSSDGIPKAINVYVRHKHTTNTETTTSTRTIYVQGQDTPQTQVVHFTRDVYKDLVTGEVTGYGNWTIATDKDNSPEQWDAVDEGKAKPGYTTYIDGVKGDTIASQTPLPNQNVAVHVTFEANPASVNVVYRNDATNVVVQTVPFTGTIDQTIPLTYTIPAGYKLAPDQNLQKSYTLKAQNGDITVYVETDPKTYTPETVPSDVPESIKDQMTKTVTRHIEIVYPEGYTGDKLATPIDQSVTFERSVTVDLTKSGADRYVLGNDWHVKGSDNTQGSWASVELTKINGYHTDQGIDAATVDANSSNVNLTIHYLADDAQLGIKAVDDTDNSDITSKIGSAIANITGKTNEAVDADKVNAAVKSAKDQLAKLGYTYVGTDVVTKFDDVVDTTAKPSQYLVIHFAHATSTYNRGDKDLPDGVDSSQLTKSVTRKIIVHTPGQTDPEVITQTATAHRQLVVDKADGSYTWTPWVVDSQFGTYNVPQVAGYTSQVDGQDATSVDAVAVVQADDNDKTPQNGKTVEVTYTAQAASQKVIYIDAASGEEVSSFTAKGEGYVTDASVDFDDQIRTNKPENYDFVDESEFPGSHKLTAGENTPVRILVKTHKDTYHDGDKNIPTGVAALSREITRTINVYGKDGKTLNHIEVQTVKFTRTATVDAKSGAITYSDWTVSGDSYWNSFDASSYVDSGYTAQRDTHIASASVTSASHDVVIDIYEKANDHAATVTYIDQTDAKNPVTVMSYTVHGQTDQDVTVPNQVPHGYKLVDEDALPAIIHFTADGAKDVTVYLVHDTADDLNSPKIDDKTKKEIEANLTKTVTRTITVHEPGKDAKNLPAQTVSFHRTFSYDVLTGQVTYGDWTPDGSTTWVAITDKSLIPDVAGYTHNTVDEVRNITADTPDAHVDVVYTPEDAQPVTFKAVNDTKSGEEIAIPADVIKSITGKTDAVVPADKVSDVISGITTALTKQGYTYVSVEGIPTKYSASGSTVTLHFKQVPGTYSTGNIPDEFRQYVSDKDLNRDVTRTIIEHLPSGDKTLVQRVHLTRTVTVDTVAFRSATNDDAKTKAISFGAWTPADSSFDEYDFDQVAGYESQVDGKAQTKADTLAALSDGQPITDVTVNVDYVAQDASQPIVYVDVVTGKTVGNTSVGGKTGESVDINTPITQNIPTGYKLVDNQSFSTTTLGATNKPIKVLVTADTKPATEEQIKADHGVVEKTIKRTIHYVVEGSGVAAPEDVTQEVHFTRSATYNPTTGKVTYGEWTPKDGESNTWASVTTPTIAGYIPTVSGFDAVTVTDRDVDEDLTVTYKPEVRNYKVNYVDQNGNVIKTDTVTGKTGDTVQINSSTPFGWNLDDGQTIPTTATLDADDTKNVATVHVHQVTKTIKGSDDTHNDALNKTVTRTVIITDTRGEQTKQVQSVHFTRNQEINLATGETHYTDWTADGDDKFDAVTAPTVDGYTIVGQAPEVDGVKATDPDTTVNISYVANKQTDTFKAVDDDQNGEPISLPGSFTTTLKGDSDTPITQDQVDSVIKDINDYLTEKGYVSKAAPTITTDEQGNKTITLHFGHGTEDTSATDPAAKKTVTRTIQFIGAGKQSPVVQTITATRTATKDTVTGETKYGDWTGSFDKYNAPVLDGYTMTIDGQDSTDGVVPSVNVDKKAPQNVTVTVVYTGKQGQQTVHYIDADTGKEVQVDNPQVIRATVGSTQEVNFTAPKGYDLIPGQKTSEEITIPATDTGIDVFVKQHVDNYDSKNNPDNLELTKDVTRTIIVNKPNEAPQSIKQTVHFTRTASVNAATGATTYSAWTVDGTDSWDAYTADDVNGYTTYVDGKEGKDVASQTVTAYTGNQTVNITYTANAKSVQIVYVDKTGKQLGSQTINGHTGSTENVTPVLPSGYQVPKDGKQVPTTITFPGDGSDLTNITITVEPTQHTYNPGDKDLDKEVSAEVRDKMFKTVTRTVNIYVPNEKGQEVKTTIVQEVHFARPVTVYGDGTVQYAKTWTPQGETKFDAINVDNFRGYDASVDGTTPSEQVPEVDNIPAETPDSTIDVHYLPQDQKVRFKVVDITDNKEITDLNITNDLESPVITGKSGTEIPTDKVKAYVDQIKKLMEARGYEFDSAIYPSDFDKDKSVDQQVILNFRHAKKNFEGTDTIPDNVKKGDNTALTKSDLIRDVTRKIILHTPNGDVEFTQHVTAPRTATVDEVTHVATLGDWTTPDFASQDVPSYRGYTAKIGDTTVTSVSSAPVAYVNDEPQNASDVVVDYVGQTGATQIDFVDKDGKIVGSSKSFEGQVGHDVTISGVTVPDGWKLAEGSTIPSSATVYADGRHVKVLVVHDTENVPSTKIPDGTTRSDGSKLTETDLKHDIVRKITLNKPAGTEVVIQHVVWSREAIVDKVTHQVVGYTDWTLNTQTPTESQDGKTTTQYGPTWKPIHTDAIKVAGYTPTTDQVTEVTPGPNANNDEITINYVAQPATVKVIYHDDKDNKDVAFDTIIGKKDGSKSTYDYQVPNGYQLAGDKTSAEFSFDGEDHYLVDGGQAIDAKTPFIIHLTHKTETFDKTSHAGFDDSDFERTVERHVRIHIPEHLEDPSVLGSFLQPGQTFEVVQSVTYERTATKDDATGKIIFSDWTIADTSGNVTENDDGSVDFKAVEAGQLAGYTPMTSAQEVAKVTADSRVSDLDIYYVENGTTITISARDNDTKSYLTIPDELQTTLTFPDVTGKDQGQKSLQSDVTAITAYFEKKGYDYVDVTQDGNHYTINFKHHIDHFTGDTCPDIPSDLDSAIKQPLTADVHREIEVHLPGQTDPVIITQTVHAHRTVSVDRAKLAKGDADAVKYDDWVFDDGDKFKAMPEAIQGYKTLINGVEAKDKNGTVPEASAKDKGGNPADGQKVVVTYQADVANAQIHYIDTDDGNKEIGTAQEVSGHSDEQKTVDTKLPDGYEYVDPSQKQVTIKFSDDGSVVSVNVLLKHKKVTTDKVPEGIKKQDGTDLTDADLTKTVTRTFDVLAPEGSKVDVPDKQTVTYKRSVTYDPVTKTVQSFGDWTAEGTDTWSQVDVPQVKGYTSVVDGTPSQVVAKVDKPQSDVTVKITYKAGQQQIRVIAVDDKTGAPIIIPVDGQALQTIIYGQTKAIVDKAQAQSYIEAIIYRLTKLGWIYDGHTEVPTLFDDDSSKDQNIVIGFHAEIDDYKPNDKLPDGAKDPNNKADQIVREMTKTRTIIFKDEKENVTKKVEQKVDFVRDVFINKVTNQVDHYGDWQYKDSNVKTWDAYDINKPGYTATVIDTTDIKNPKPLAKSEIDKQVVDDKSSDIELTVTYTKNPVKEDSGNNHGGNTSSGENGHKSGNTPEISNGKGVKTTLRGIKTPKRATLRSSNLVGKNARKLPQTGSDKEASAALGLAALGMSSALAYASKRKKRRN
ncbi:mucin-binding protein [Lactobacillus jensenii]|uniref:mucin-binding protein n=1 Tax=Lactobacillus jensenii TaxID=109790 RepID=UPI001197F93A|nr:LPXTG cell wall anchor domain-containing protein [Lactobacillus jensenii]MCF1843333.1 LPXTG cell wall anchor domain-containing protein [Lactobacillus jensenii]TVV06268.1 LPXTG cell wall anchor domain-containing protein [Lactobacillus jensenii]